MWPWLEKWGLWRFVTSVDPDLPSTRQQPHNDPYCWGTLNWTCREIWNMSKYHRLINVACFAVDLVQKTQISAESVASPWYRDAHQFVQATPNNKPPCTYRKYLLVPCTMIEAWHAYYIITVIRALLMAQSTIQNIKISEFITPIVSNNNQGIFVQMSTISKRYRGTLVFYILVSQKSA